MNKGQREKLTALNAALKSGAYVHGKGLLFNILNEGQVTESKTHCCLGVMCELEGIEFKPQYFGVSGTLGAFGFISDGVIYNAVAPLSIATLYGMVVGSGVLVNAGGGSVCTLSAINDASEDGFGPVIATIEAYLDHYDTHPNMLYIQVTKQEDGSYAKEVV